MKLSFLKNNYAGALLLISCFILLIPKCYPQSGENKNSQVVIADSALLPYKFISNKEAEKIIGKPVHVRDSLRKLSNGYLRLQFTYLSNEADSLNGLKRSLYFSYERYQENTTAKRAYDLIKAENEKLYAIKEIENTGDEGFYIKDQAGFPFIMIHKNNRVYKLKLYYVTGSESFEELQLLIKKIVSEF